MKFLLSLLLSAVLLCSCTSPVPRLEQQSVTIEFPTASGSGVVFTRTDSHGNPVSFVWTAGHVARHARNESGGYDPVSVVQVITEAGRVVGRTELSAKVIRCDEEQDIALLELNSNRLTSDGARFYTNIVATGTRVLHVGSLGGFEGAGTVSDGVMSKHGVEVGSTFYDQVSVTAKPGCSGGGVYLADGRLIGLLVMQQDTTVNLIVPARRIASWAAREDVLWAVDPSLPLPDVRGPQTAAQLLFELFRPGETPRG